MRQLKCHRCGSPELVLRETRWLATEAAMVLTFDRPEPPEDGEQCIRCLRYTYDPHCGQCMNCGFQMHPEED